MIAVISHTECHDYPVSADREIISQDRVTRVTFVRNAALK